MNNYIAVGYTGNITKFNADSDINAKDFMDRRFGAYWHHHYKLYKGQEVD